MKTYNVSMYGHGGCAVSCTITGNTDVDGIKSWYKIRYPQTELIAITRTNDGYKVDHTGRQVVKRFRDPDPEMMTVYTDYFSGIVEVENLI